MELVDLPDYQAVAAAITDMTVRGAPAIGASAAFGMALAAKQSSANSIDALLLDLDVAATVLKAARPTAVNLAWGVDRLMVHARKGNFQQPDDLRDAMLHEAQAGG